jgi:hypothetical protein
VFETETVVDPGGGVCEDLVGVVEGAAWALDGTSGSGDRSFTDGESDGRWYVEALDEALRRRVGDGPPAAVVEGAIGDVTERLADAVPADATESPETAVRREELPACTVAMATWDEETLRQYVLCDAALVRRDAVGVERVSSPGALDELDAATLRARQSYLADNPGDHEGAVAASADRVRAGRRHANAPGGYWVAQTNPAAARFGATRATPVDAVEDVLLHTDGFDPLVESYGAFTDWDAALDEVRESGLAAVVERLREVERSDPDLTEHPRLKVHDDAGVVHLAAASRSR